MLSGGRGRFPGRFYHFSTTLRILRREAEGEPFRHALTGGARMRLRVSFRARVIEVARERRYENLIKSFHTRIHEKQDNCLVFIAPTARWILMILVLDKKL